MGKKSSSKKFSKISVSSARRPFCLRVLRVFCIIYDIKISPSPPIFKLTMQTRIRLKYLSTLCFNMLLSIDTAVKKRDLEKREGYRVKPRDTILAYRVFIFKSACCFLSK